MTLYVILVFAAILIGMSISVAAFGTGSKRSKVFKDIYFSVEDVDGKGILYTKNGEYSAILKISNSVQKYSANIDSYYDFSNLIAALISTLGEGYSIHKQDVFCKKRFFDDTAGNHNFLSEAYFDYFKGRSYTDNFTYLTITQENRKSRLLSYDSKKWRDFLVKIQKVYDQLKDRNVKACFLTGEEARDFVDRFFCQNFIDKNVSMSNFKVGEEYVDIGRRKFKTYSLVDVDNIILPSKIRPFANIEVNNVSMPVDLMSMIDTIPDALNIVYNQVIMIPGQKQEKGKLTKKKNRHASLPSPSNQIAVDDIKKVEDEIARENKILVYCHFNVIVTVNQDTDFQKCTNHLENTFSRLGIHISQKDFNQLELFVGSFPGNCYMLNEEYDRFLTLSDAASCLMYKERIPHSEKSPLKIYFTDRQGVPVGVDITGKEGEEKLTDNSNFFCLGPSGSGKSFLMNTVLRQLHEQITDVVIVDTGNSYIGLCNYFNGKYISYTEEHPITMNPFRIKREEFNVEKVGFLKNLIMLIWKGSQGTVSKTEDRLIEQVITEYYDVYFNGFKGFTAEQRSALHHELLLDENTRKNNDDSEKSVEAINDIIDAKIRSMEARRRSMKVVDLSFNSFYEYSIRRIPDICSENKLKDIDISTYRYMMKDFYRGGNHEKTLNEDLDSTLFDETFIVFEIDSIKDDPLLFPLVTLIIMDVFIQKMRIKDIRKVLVIEEAWKAIASPMMAEYIKYLYKTARKFWASVGVVTQEIQDIVGSPIVKEAIINNSDVIMLLDQSKFRERFDEIQQILGLTDVECKKIFTINRLDNKEGRAFFREVFIRRGLVSDVFGVEEPRECYMTYTTERIEKEALFIYLKELNCSYPQAIMSYVRDWNRSGIDKSLTFAQKVYKAQHVLNLK